MMLAGKERVNVLPQTVRREYVQRAEFMDRSAPTTKIRSLEKEGKNRIGMIRILQSEGWYNPNPENL